MIPLPYTQDASKTRYYQGMIRLMGGIDQLAFLREDYMLRLLDNAQVKKGTAFTLHELMQIALPRQHHTDFLNIMTRLAAQSVFMRGYRLTCPVCDLTLWYELSAVQEMTPCRGCLMPFQLPLDLSFAYRLNHLFCMGLNQGAASVLLMLLWLHEHYEKVTWEACIIIQQTEVDLIVHADDDLLLIECKNVLTDKQTSQIERVKALAEAIGGKFMLAVLSHHQLKLST